MIPPTARAILVLFLVGSLVSCAQESNRRKDADTYLADANKALLDEKCWNAQQLFRNLLSDYPGSHLVDDAQYGLGQAYFCSKDYETAIFEFERLINEYPVSKFIDKARFQIGMCYFNQSRSIHHDQEETVLAIREFTRFVEDFPNSDIASEARKRIGDLDEKLASKDLMIARNYLKWKNPASSEIFCRRLLEKYPDTRMGEEVRFVLAVALHRQGELDEALEILDDRAGLKTPESLSLEIEAERKEVQKAISKAVHPSPEDGVSGQVESAAALPGT
ncbi:MAG: hypothetical protein CME21_22600 [Gemmatimonadetes bacterium]|nr:hypothetical protein [Gemmatimonadota bacterium]